MQPPEVLYHYCSNETLVSIITGKSIRISSVKMSNDSQEGLLILDRYRQIIKEDYPNQHLHNIIEGRMELMCNLFDALAFCLSEKGDLLSQWRGYANNGKGVAIGFKTEQLKNLHYITQESERLPLELQRVTYHENEHHDKIKPTIKQIIESKPIGALLERLESKTEISPTLFDPDLLRIFNTINTTLLLGWGEAYTIKSEAFDEEKEWRLFQLFAKGLPSEFKANDDKIIQFRTINLPTGEDSPIASITLGPKNSTPPETIKTLLSMNNFKDASINKSKASYR